MSDRSSQTMREWRKRRIMVLSKLTDEAVKSGCADCGIMHPAVLQFHHRDGKDGRRGVKHLVRTCRSERIITEEIAKCDILCANCHILRHHAEQTGYFAQAIGEEDGE
jgi:integrase